MFHYIQHPKWCGFITSNTTFIVSSVQAKRICGIPENYTYSSCIIVEWSILTIQYTGKYWHYVNQCQWIDPGEYGEYMMTSSQGSFFHVTVPLCGELTGHRICVMPSQRTGDTDFDIFVMWVRIGSWINSRMAGDLSLYGIQVTSL